MYRNYLLAGFCTFTAHAQPISDKIVYKKQKIINPCTSAILTLVATILGLFKTWKQNSITSFKLADMKHKVVIKSPVMLQCKKSRLVLINSILKIVLMVWIKSTIKQRTCQPFVQHSLGNKLQCRGSVLGVLILAISEFCRSWCISWKARHNWAIS